MTAAVVQSKVVSLATRTPGRGVSSIPRLDPTPRRSIPDAAGAVGEIPETHSSTLSSAPESRRSSSARAHTMRLRTRAASRACTSEVPLGRATGVRQGRRNDADAGRSRLVE
jgi:hypothetical protein